MKPMKRRIKAAWHVLRGKPTMYGLTIKGGHLPPPQIASEGLYAVDCKVTR